MLVAVPAAAAEPCFGDFAIGVDAVMDDAAVDQLAAALEAGGTECGPPLLEAFLETPTGPMTEVVTRAFGSWRDEAHLPILYAAYGEAMLQAHGRNENVAAGTAAAVGATLGPDGYFLGPAAAPAVHGPWIELAADRYRSEWRVELSETSGEPPLEQWRPLAGAAFASCLDDPTGAPPDPFDPLGLNPSPLAAMSMGTRCASLAVLTAWQEAEPDGDWAFRVRGLAGRYATGGLEWLGLELERGWKQGAAEPLASTPSWAALPREEAPTAPPWRTPVAVLAVLLALIVGLAARSERGREWLKRGAAVGFGLSLLGLVELAGGAAGIELGDELRPRPEPRLAITETGHHRDARHRFFPEAPAPGRARVVVVGASSIVGPGLAESESVPGVLRRRLNGELNGCVDVINAGAHGVASTVIRSRAIDAVDRLGADAVVVYTGHNEVGMMREKNRYRGALDRWFVPRTHARRTRWWTLLSAVVPEETPISSIGEPVPAAPGEDASPEAFVRALTASFDREMTDLARALERRGVPLVLVQPGFNHHGLRIPTEGSNTTERAVDALTSGRTEQALELTAKLLGDSPDHPMPWFLRGLALEQSGDLAGAEEAIWACARVNLSASSITPDLALLIDGLGSREGVTVVDAHGLLHRASGEHLPGFDLFSDYVHLNPRGAAVVADGVMEALDVAALGRLCESR